MCLCSMAASFEQIRFGKAKNLLPVRGVLRPKTDWGGGVAENWTQKDRGKNGIWGQKDRIL